MLLQIDRLFLRTSAKATLIVFPMVNWASEYPLILLFFHQNRFNDWYLFNEVLKPLSIQEISMNNYFRIDFYEMTHNFKIISNMIKDNNNSPSNPYFYKHNMTINLFFELSQYKVLPEGILKKDISSFVNTQSNILSEQTNSGEMLFYPWSLLLKSPRNIMGEILALTASPSFNGLIASKISMDLRLQLTRLLIKYNFKASKVNLNDSEFINPYTGEKPFIHDGSICYKEPSEEEEELNICLSFELPNALNN